MYPEVAERRGLPGAERNGTIHFEKVLALLCAPLRLRGYSLCDQSSCAFATALDVSVCGQRTEFQSDVPEWAEHELRARPVTSPEHAGELHVGAAGDLEDIRAAIARADACRDERLTELDDLGS